ncbi:MAG: hypothetical protein AB7O44_27570 [Hyphomicrobiaceae bacterium]
MSADLLADPQPAPDPNERKNLLDWLSDCDFSLYSTAALQAAYDALVDDAEEPPATPIPDICPRCNRLPCLCDPAFNE